MFSKNTTLQILLGGARSLRFRNFSSFSQVSGKSIKLSTHYPPKLRIPAGRHQQYDVTLDSEETVSQFEQKVRENCDIKEFKVLGGDKDAKVEQVIKRKFQIEVNGKERYDVYPHLEAMVDKPANPKVRAIIDKALEGRSIPISRRVILYHYFDKVVQSLKEKSTGGLT
jgi:hypothetical protein